MSPQIVIPMSGFGERFKRAGFTVPKPLIEIEGKPIIAHVIELFPGEKDFFFVCNQDHLDNSAFNLRDLLQRYCPTGRILGIRPHKLGPVHAVSEIFPLLDPNRSVVVNYCDFTCFWDWRHFLFFVNEFRCHGAVPAYRGFHPHSLGTTNYAYVREENGWALDIQEKQPFTDNRMEEYASTGTYYFATAALMCDAFKKVVEDDLSINGEFYVSLAYKPLIEAGKRIAVYEVQHFMQWGTPEDMREYRTWSQSFRNLVDTRYSTIPKMAGTGLIPMAGFGERFSRAGFPTAKPLIPVSGKPMAIQAAGDLPVSNRKLFVLRRDMPELNKIEATLQDVFPTSERVILDGATDGQARTALLGWRTAPPASGPLTIGACDTGILYDHDRFLMMLRDPTTDVIVWVARGHPGARRSPTMYGWVASDGDQVTSVSVKTPLDNPDHDPIVIGTFTFRRPEDFESAVERMIARDARVNGEFYVDTCINDAVALGLRVRIFEVESYLCWGTPNDLRTFEYWQSCFDKWSGHPYGLENDSRVAREAIPGLRARYRARLPQNPNQ